MGRFIKTIDSRLHFITDMLLEKIKSINNPVVADIGCDHGLTTLYLLQQCQELSVIASDISEESLKKTKHLIQQFAMEDRVQTIVGDGLDIIPNGQRLDAVMITGMGGRTILDILKRGIKKCKKSILILQANSEIEFLREGINRLGFRIDKEGFPEVKGRIYVVMRAENYEFNQSLTYRHYLLGTAVDGIKSAGQQSYFLQYRKRILRNITKCSNSPQISNIDKRQHMIQILGIIEEALRYKMINVGDVENIVNEIAPFDLAEEWDNVGLLVGNKKNIVSAVLVALDLTENVIQKAEKLGVQVIITHHPIILKPINKITNETREGRLIIELNKLGISLITAHTNLDSVQGGVNDVLMEKINAFNIRGGGFVRVGDINPVKLSVLCDQISNTLNTVVRMYGDPEKMICVLGCCSGSGGNEYSEVMKLGAECFLTGEIKHHVALDAIDAGCCVIEAGHYETENPVCSAFATALQKKADELEYSLNIYTYTESLFTVTK